MTEIYQVKKIDKLEVCGITDLTFFGLETQFDVQIRLDFHPFTYFSDLNFSQLFPIV